jgi:hypothetical protein
MLTPKIVKAYHCTRLTDNEVAAIRCHGLTLPSIHLWQEKIKNSQKNERASAQRLMQFVGVGLKSYELMNPKIHFCLSAELLKNPAATHRFFRNWGGEIFWQYRVKSRVQGSAWYRDRLDSNRQITYHRSSVTQACCNDFHREIHATLGWLK